MNLTQGSSGEDVRKLQQALIDAGYSVGASGADGIYGANTANAVRQYQQANGLGVDGIAGTNTQGKLYGTAAGTQQAVEPAKPAYATPTDTYKPSETVEAYKLQLQQQLANKPGQYQSQYRQQLDDLYQQITGRAPFSYDAAGDALYQQYRDQYQQLGKQAMADTMGQAAALTGGYGSTYSQSAGQQQYDAYLRQLTDKLPELEQAAYNRYAQEGADLQNRLALLQSREEGEYGRYRDTLGDWQNELARLESLYSNERNYDYNRAMDERDYAYQLASDNRKYAYDTAMGMISAGMLPSDQMLADAGLSKADAQTMLAAYLAQAASKGGGGRGGRGGGGGKGKSETPLGVDDATYKNIRDTVVMTARYKGLAAGAQKLLEYADQLSDDQLNWIDAYMKSRSK